MTRRFQRDGRKRYPAMAGSEGLDSDQVFKIKQYLRKEHRILSSQIKVEHAIRITRRGCRLLGKLSREKISQIRGLIHTPDIIVVDKDDRPLLIIEQDGRIHDSLEKMKKDKIRNSHYDRAGIPYVVLSTKAIRSSGAIPATYLDDELKRIGMPKPAGSCLGV